MDINELKKLIADYERDMEKYLNEISNADLLVQSTQVIDFELRLSGLVTANQLTLTFCLHPSIFEGRSQ
jgi:hypothetical protein